MVDYHWSTKANDFRECSSPQNCPLGGDHFNNLEEAYASKFESVANPVEKTEPTGKTEGTINFANLSEESLKDIMLADLERDANQVYKEAYAGSQKDRETVDQIGKIIESRKALAAEYWDRIKDLDKNKADGGDRKLFAEKKRTYNAFRDNTAAFVEARLQSPHFVSKVVEDTSDAVGELSQTTAHEPNTRAWLAARQDTFGGSDVGIVAVMDFAKDGNETSQFRRMRDTKTRGYTEDELNARENQDDTRSGALYRGNAWEDQIREDFAKDHPEYTILNNKGQFAHPDRPWQQVNFDGLICKSGTTEPEGILEIKTGTEPAKWENGVPLDYRAQTLYYLQATGFKYAKVRVLLNDHETRDFTIQANDPIAPNTDTTMPEYVKNRIAPLREEFANIRSSV